MSKKQEQREAAAVAALDTLLAELRTQYTQRMDIYESAGGDPRTARGDLTCYLPYDLLRTLFPLPPVRK